MSTNREIKKLPKRLLKAAEEAADKARNEQQKSVLLESVAQGRKQVSAKLRESSNELITHSRRLADGVAAAASVGVLDTELDVGLTFARIALQSHPSSAKRHRNQANARKAYDTVVHWGKRLRLTAAERRELGIKFKELATALEQLGETF